MITIKNMLNKVKHQGIMTGILKKIYSDTTLGPLLGFKGGTCAYLFYNLPRFSVDLDFDLLKIEDTGDSDRQIILEKINKIASKYGRIKDSYNKNFTIFSLVSYGEKDHNIKIEISRRELPYNIRDKFLLNEHLGVPLLVAKKEYLFAGKLSAFCNRKTLAIRDVFDINYYAEQLWDIDREVLNYWVKKDIAEYFDDCVKRIGLIEDNQLLVGIGELIDEKQKIWMKQKLKSDTIFNLKNYLPTLK